MDEGPPFITVSELTLAVKNQLESQFHTLSVQGEVSNAKLHASGHLYFDLKDAGAKIGAVMFRPQCQTLKRPVKEGDRVLVRGTLSVYPPHGKYQLLVRSLEPMGIGDLLLQLEALKKKLRERGWFSPEHKKPLPTFPRTIGVITSPTGAVIRDIIHILSRRVSRFHLLLYPVRVQGIEAADEIAQAIRDCNTHSLADVLIVCRGGGSLEDLWAFNEERVAEAIFASTIPIISAVGHETDITIADFVADVRAPTPSAAAEIVTAESAQQLTTIRKASAQLHYTLLHRIRQMQLQLMHYRKHPSITSPYTWLSPIGQKLDDLTSQLQQAMQRLLLHKKYLLAGRQKQALALQPTQQLALLHAKKRHLQKCLETAISLCVDRKRQRLHEIIQQLSALDPKRVLQRGYTILLAEKDRSVIMSIQELTPGQQLYALLSDGQACVTVDST